MNRNRPIPWKRILQFLIFSLIALVTLVALGLSWVSFQGRRDWAKTKADLLARGEKLSIIELAPPAIPDDQNFFADPMWTELIEYKTLGENGKTRWKPSIPKEQTQLYALDKPLPASELKAIREKFPAIDPARDRENLADEFITEAQNSNDAVLKTEAASAALEILEPLRPLLARVHELLNRPKAYFPIAYERGLLAPTPQISGLLPLSHILSSRAQAALILRDRQTAFTSTLDQLRLARIIGNEPTLISIILRLGMTNFACRNIREGISLHIWQEPELVAFQDALDQIHLFPELARALRGERGMGNTVFESLGQASGATLDAINPSSSGGFLTGRFYRALFRASDQASYNLIVQRTLDALHTAPILETLPIDQLDTEIENRATGPMTYTRLLSNLLLPALGEAIRSTAKTQDQVFMLRIACALERYRLTNNTYPTALTALVPSFLPEVPADVVAERPFHYLLENPSQFQLWSIGWDGVDDHGVSDRHTRKGDWPWNPPTPAHR